MNKTATALLIAAIPLLFSAATAKETKKNKESIRLVYTFSGKKPVRYVCSHSNTQEINGIGLASSMTVQCIMTDNATKMQGGNWKLHSQLSNIVFTVKGMAMAGVEDSLYDFSTMDSVFLEATISPQGTISNRVVNASKPALDNETVGVSQLLANSLYSIPPMVLEFPDKEITVGETWVQTLKNIALPQLEDPTGKNPTLRNMTCTLKGILDTMGMQCWKIACSSGEFSLANVMKLQGHEVQFEGKGSIRAEYYFSKDQGIMIAGKSLFETDMYMNITGMESQSESIHATIATQFHKEHQ